MLLLVQSYDGLLTGGLSLLQINEKRGKLHNVKAKNESKVNQQICKYAPCRHGMSSHFSYYILQQKNCNNYQIAILMSHYKSLKNFTFHDIFMPNKPLRQAFTTVPVLTLNHFIPKRIQCIQHFLFFFFFLSYFFMAEIFSHFRKKKGSWYANILSKVCPFY